MSMFNTVMLTQYC